MEKEDKIPLIESNKCMEVPPPQPFVSPASSDDGDLCPITSSLREELDLFT